MNIFQSIGNGIGLVACFAVFLGVDEVFFNGYFRKNLKDFFEAIGVGYIFVVIFNTGVSWWQGYLDFEYFVFQISTVIFLFVVGLIRYFIIKLISSKKEVDK